MMTIVRPRNQIEPWWDKNESEPHQRLVPLVEWLIAEQQYYETSFTHFLRMYSNRAAAAATGRSYSSAVDAGERIRMNVIKSALDTSVAMIAAERSRPIHTTKRGDIEARKKMQRTDQFILGVFLEQQYYIKNLQTYLDAGIFGSGFMRIDHNKGKVFMERVPTTDVIFDDNECKYGQPRMLYIMRDLDRDWLADRFPKKKHEIRASDRIVRSFTDMHGSSDPTTVVLGYRLPEAEGAPGRFCICTNNCTLEDGEWKDPFPLTKWDHQPPLFGYIGMGAVEELQPLQVEINYIAQKIQKLMTLATSMVWMQKGSGVASINNRDMAVREYRGNRPPVFQTTSAVSAEYFHHMDRIYAKAFELVGISQLQAQGKKPAGLDSGEALQVYHDIGTQRFKHVGQRWAQCHVDAGERVLDAARRARKAGFKVKILSAETTGATEVDFDEIHMPPDSYTTQVFPANLLPDEPAGKLEALEKLVNTDPNLRPYAMGLLRGTPDVDYLAQLSRAPLDLIEMKLENMLEHGKPESPEPHMNMQLALDWASRHLSQGQVEGLPEERLDLVRSFIAQTEDEMKKAQEAAMQQQFAMQQQAAAQQQQPQGGAGAPPPNIGG